MSVLVVQSLIDNFQWPRGAALALILAITGAVAVALYARSTRGLMRGIE